MSYILVGFDKEKAIEKVHVCDYREVCIIHKWYGFDRHECLSGESD